MIRQYDIVGATDDSALIKPMTYIKRRGDSGLDIRISNLTGVTNEQLVTLRGMIDTFLQKATGRGERKTNP